MTMADRICIMDRGRIVQMGTPTEIYDHPNSRYVAGFIGSMSFLEGTVAAVDGTMATVEVPGAGALRATLGQPLETAAAASFSVRPEQLVPVAADAAVAGLSLRGRLVDLTPTGAASLARVAVGEGEVVAQVSRAFSAALGDELVLGWDPAAARVFGGRSK